MGSIAIIGGGLAGLAAGIALLQDGHRVDLYEANGKLGGCCSTTFVDGYTFNDGALYVALPALLDRGFDILGLDRGEALTLRQITALQTSRLPDGAEVTIEAGARVRLPGPPGKEAEAQREVDALVAKWKPFVDVLVSDLVVRPFSLLNFLAKAWRYLPMLRGTVADELEASISDPGLRAALSSVLLYTGLPPERTPATQIVGLVAMLTDQCFMPVGGMGCIPEVLASRYAQLGGKVFLDTAIEAIVVGKGRVTGLRTAAGHVLPATQVISTTSAMTTYARLLPRDAVPSSLLKKVDRAPLSQRALSIQLGLADRVTAQSHFMGLIPGMAQQAEMLLPGYGTQWLSYTVPTVTLPELAPTGGSIIELYPAVDQRLRPDEWTASHASRVVDESLALLASLHPLRIAARRVRTPRDFQRDLHLYQGAIYGLSPAADARAQFPHRTPVKGLYQAGQTTFPGYGVGPALLGGIFAAAELGR